MREKQREIIAALGVRPTIEPGEEIEKRSRFLADSLARTGLEGFVLGISGGQDSLLAGLLAQRAVELRRSDGQTAAFHAMLLPYGRQADRADAELAVRTIAPDAVHDLDIKPGVDAIAEAYAASEGHAMRDFDKGNVKARVRMIAQYALASEHQLLVLGTDHAAEAVHGFYTKHGDGAADILPLAGLNKRQGRAMLEALGAPAIFMAKAPTADLLDTSPGQTDESEIGVALDDTDDYLEGKAVADRTAEIIEAHYDATQHKRALPVAYTG